ncbi:serine/threonine protein kinase [Planococcus sp. NCCP-2050]|uniref:serine/threonine protein kinase n=1 Tax=Planococcus sp. NCCP-2050 TaxID=2944679 RepID=UPI00203E18D9|nr:serine/threonine protein kinase [Planococcus sp. NCCP-2050]GKW45988.1 hypothetical protein NCCP2050_16800 [Planococcus sp. NCCP-2050]
MGHTWQHLADALEDVKVISNPGNEPVTIEGIAAGMRCVGVGTDAAVFQSMVLPQFAFKLFAEGKQTKLQAEAKVYKILGTAPGFSRCYGVSTRFLVLKFEEGPTFFDCLLQGIHIPEEAVRDVENAREFVRQKGLNPRDIHLKNIVLQEGRAKLLDVSEYIKPGNDFRWDHLKMGYTEYYHLIDSKPMPFWVLDTVRKGHHRWQRYFTSFDEFMSIISKQIGYRK